MPFVRRALFACALFAAAAALAWAGMRRPWRIGDLPRPDAALRIDVNAASEEELAVLPAVEPGTAAAIVRERAAGGPFRDMEDLGRVKGLGPRKLAQLAPWVTLK